MAKADFITSIFLILLSLFIMIYVLLEFPRFPEWGGLYSNPGFTPFLLGLTLNLMSIYLFIRSLKRGGHQIYFSRNNIKLFLNSIYVRRFFICFSLFLIYYFLFGYISFIFLTFVYLFFSILIFKGAKWWTDFIISGFTSIVIYYVFTRVFLIPLP